MLGSSPTPALFAARFSGFLRLLVLCLVGAMPAGAARAQEVSRVEPYFVVPTAGDVKLRCHHGSLFYHVAVLDKSQVLRVDGEVDGWLQVEYPPGAPVVVRYIEGEVTADRTKVRLTRRPKLRAYNRENPLMDECFKSVVIEDPPMPGTEVRLIQTIKNRAGDTGGYLIDAPPGSKGYILASEVRRATPEEAARFVGLGAAPAAPAPATAPAPAPAPVSTPAPAQPEPQPVAPAPVVQTPPASNVPTDTATAMPTQPAPAPAPPVAQPAPAEQTVPYIPPAEPVAIEGQPAPATEPAPAPTPAPAPAPARVMNLNELDQAFDRLSMQSTDSAEYEELITQYQRYADTLADDELTQRTRAYIDARIKLLALRAELQRNQAQLAALRARAQETAQTAQSSAERIESTRDYIVVGRLLTSSIYDGQRLPLMYRIQAVETGRTLAYVTPVPALGLDGRLGQIVGVRGKGSLDPSSRVQVVEPTAIDLLEQNPDHSSRLPVGLPGAAPAPDPVAAPTPTAAPAPVPAAAPVESGTSSGRSRAVSGQMRDVSK